MKKLISILMSVVMLMSVTAGLSFNALAEGDPQPILPNASYSSLLDVNGKKYYKFTLPSAGVYNFEGTGAEEFSFFIKTPDDPNFVCGGYIDKDSTGKVSGSFSFDLKAGDYNMKLDGTPNTEFSFNTSFAPSSDSFADTLLMSDDTIEKANAVSYKTEYTGTISSTASDIDFYAFDVAAKQNVILTFTGTGKRFRAHLYGADKKKIAAKDFVKDEKTGVAKGKKIYNLDPGKYYLKIDGFGGSYSFNLTAYARPAKVKIKSLKAGAGQLKVVWKKNGSKGYQIEYSRNKKFEDSQKVTVKKGNKKVIKGLESGKKYYVRVRAYKDYVNKKKLFGDWSKVKTVKVK